MRIRVCENACKWSKTTHRFRMCHGRMSPKMPAIISLLPCPHMPVSPNNIQCRYDRGEEETDGGSNTAVYRPDVPAFLPYSGVDYAVHDPKHDCSAIPFLDDIIHKHGCRDDSICHHLSMTDHSTCPLNGPASVIGPRCQYHRWTDKRLFHRGMRSLFRYVHQMGA